MNERIYAPWLVGALALALIHCAGDQQAEPSSAPMPPPAEPPTEISSPAPAASVAAKPPEEANASSNEDKGTKDDKAAKDKPKSATLSDPQIAAITDIANTAEIEQGKVARAKSKNAEVLKFSAMMITHHGEAKQKQSMLKLASADSAASTQMVEDGNKVLATLKEAKGADFDKRYFEAQVEGHQKLLDTLNNELLPNVKNSELKAYLEEIKPRVEQHLKAARDAQRAIEASSGAGGTSGGGTSKK